MIHEDITIGSVQIIRGDSLRVLSGMPDASVDAVVTDPPYSSGGFTRSDRNASTSAKYTLTGTQKSYPEFYGDNRDARSFAIWASIWMAECFRITKPTGCMLCFTDWRQLPSMTDAIQVGGWIWRSLTPWDKTEGSRPEMGWFRNQAEYIIGATRGSRGRAEDRPVQKCLPGVFRIPVERDKQHMTAKPVELMRAILEVVPAGGVVLDPFAGSGSTLIAARDLGLKSIGIELSTDYIDVIKRRLEQPVFAFSPQPKPQPKQEVLL